MMNDPNYAICPAGDSVHRLGPATWQHTDDDTPCTHTTENTTIGWITFTIADLDRWLSEHPSAQIGIVLPRTVEAGAIMFGLSLGCGVTTRTTNSQWRININGATIRVFTIRNEPRELIDQLRGINLDLVLADHRLEDQAVTIRAVVRPNTATSTINLFALLDTSALAEEVA